MTVWVSRYGPDSTGGVEYLFRPISEAAGFSFYLCMSSNRKLVPSLTFKNKMVIFVGENWGRIGRIDLNLSVMIFGIFLALIGKKTFVHLPFIQALPICFLSSCQNVMVHSLSNSGKLGKIHERLLISCIRRHRVNTTCNAIRDALHRHDATLHITVTGVCLSKEDESLAKDVWNRKENEQPVRCGRRFIFCGRNARYKGLNYILDAWWEHSISHPEDRLVLVGPGTEALKGRSRSLDALGFADKEVMYNEIKKSDYLILASIDEGEAFGIVQVEAMFLGVTPIVTDVGTGTHHVAGPFATVIAPKSVEELISSMKNAPIRGGVEREKARHYALKNYGRNHVIPKYQEFLSVE